MHWNRRSCQFSAPVIFRVLVHPSAQRFSNRLSQTLTPAPPPSLYFERAALERMQQTVTQACPQYTIFCLCWNITLNNAFVDCLHPYDFSYSQAKPPNTGIRQHFSDMRQLHKSSVCHRILTTQWPSQPKKCWGGQNVWL